MRRVKHMKWSKSALNKWVKLLKMIWLQVCTAYHKCPSPKPFSSFHCFSEKTTPLGSVSFIAHMVDFGAYTHKQAKTKIVVNYGWKVSIWGVLVGPIQQIANIKLLCPFPLIKFSAFISTSFLIINNCLFLLITMPPIIILRDFK